MNLRLAVAALIGALVGTSEGGAQAVSGRVTILERLGEVTEDLQNVVVYLEAVGAPPRSQPSAPANSVIALQSRQFSPRVRVIMQGSRIEFPNQDPFSHNVFSKTNGGFDTGSFGRGKTRDQLFQQAGVYALYCNVHPRMTAFVIALNTPYYTQAGVDGRFVFDSVPPGNYKLHVWHDRTNAQVRDVRVTATGVRNLAVELDAKGYKYVQHKNKFGQVYTSATGDRY
jgi:plastocyanin